MPLGAADMAHDLVPVSLGNLFGGSVLVAWVYYVIYIRGERLAAGAMPPADAADAVADQL